MYSLHLICRPQDVDQISAELWELDTAGIRELDESHAVHLIAGFESNQHRELLLSRFAANSPAWLHEDNTDWTQLTRDAWPPRLVGERFFLCAPWCEDETPAGRLRLIQNPGLACGTGEHPCTQMALGALERAVEPESTVVDVGAGSAILTIGALLLGARQALGVDTDETSLHAAVENFSLNNRAPRVAAASAAAIRSDSADVTVANISGTVLLNIWDDLLRITKKNGTLILTGFPESELAVFQCLLPNSEAETIQGWCCLRGPNPR